MRVLYDTIKMASQVVTIVPPPPSRYRLLAEVEWAIDPQSIEDLPKMDVDDAYVPTRTQFRITIRLTNLEGSPFPGGAIKGLAVAGAGYFVSYSGAALAVPALGVGKQASVQSGGYSVAVPGLHNIRFSVVSTDSKPVMLTRRPEDEGDTLLEAIVFGVDRESLLTVSYLRELLKKD